MLRHICSDVICMLHDLLSSFLSRLMKKIQSYYCTFMRALCDSFVHELVESSASFIVVLVMTRDGMVGWGALHLPFLSNSEKDF
jgi:hypothetical protein